MTKKLYVPKVGDRVRLAKLHKDDAHYQNKDVEEIFDKILIIDSIEHTSVGNGFIYAATHCKESGEEWIFYAAKFKRV